MLRALGSRVYNIVGFQGQGTHYAQVMLADPIMMLPYTGLLVPFDAAFNYYRWYDVIPGNAAIKDKFFLADPYLYITYFSMAVSSSSVPASANICFRPQKEGWTDSEIMNDTEVQNPRRNIICK